MAKLPEKKLLEIKKVIDRVGQITYQEIADAVGVDKKDVNKQTLELIYGVDNIPRHKIIRAGMRLTNPVCSANGSILISERLIRAGNFREGERFDVKVDTEKRTITLISEGVDREYIDYRRKKKDKELENVTWAKRLKE